MTHPLIEAVARALSEAVDACAATGTHTLPDMLMDPDIIARAAVLATLRGLRRPSPRILNLVDEALADSQILDLGDADIRRSTYVYFAILDAAITEIGGPDA